MLLSDSGMLMVHAQQGTNSKDITFPQLLANASGCVSGHCLLSVALPRIALAVYTSPHV